MNAIKNFNPLLTFKASWILAIIIIVVTGIMLGGASERYSIITDDVIGNAPRESCPISTDINIELHRVEYTANCSWGTMIGILNTFQHLTDSPEFLSCYSAEYLGDTFSGCSLPEKEEEENSICKILGTCTEGKEEN